MGFLEVLENPWAFQECRRGARTTGLASHPPARQLHGFRQAFQLPGTQVPPLLDEDPRGHNVEA